MIYETIDDAYRNEVKRIIKNGHVVLPRGQRTKETLSRKIIINNGSNLYNGFTGKDYRVALGAAMVTTFSKDVSKRFQKDYNESSFFTDNYDIFAYNRGSSLKQAIEILKQDRNSRQSVLEYGAAFCTNTVNFLIRGGKLIIEINARSIDAFKKFPIDAQYFSILQQMVSNELNVKCGYIIFNITSFHIYTKDMEDIYKMQVIRKGESLYSTCLGLYLKFKHLEEFFGGEVFERHD